MIRSPSLSASSSLLRTSTPQPSEKTVPSADLSKAAHFPDFDCMPNWEVKMWPYGLSISDMPPAIANALSLLRRLSHARWMAVSDDEHAVSTASAGPFRFRKYEILAAKMDVALPEKACGTRSCRLTAKTRE